MDRQIAIDVVMFLNLVVSGFRLAHLAGVAWAGCVTAPLAGLLGSLSWLEMSFSGKFPFDFNAGMPDPPAEAEQPV